jgi:hypothetical protein
MRNARGHPRATVPVVAALLLSLTGCTSAPAEPTATPSPTATPVFASDEEALAAAEKAYADYLAMSDMIFRDGGKHPERLEAVATAAIVESESEAFAEVERNGWHAEGESKFDSVKLQSANYPSWSATSITLYVCSDVSGLDVLDPAGVSVVAQDRPSRQPFQVTFVGNSAERLLLERKELWEGVGVC